MVDASLFQVDIDIVEETQLRVKQDIERLMQKDLSKDDTPLLLLRLQQRDELADKLKQLREKELVLLRQSNKE